jgi:trans-aconitate methyltransferase
MPKQSGWDAEAYEAQHAFVWQLGEKLLDILDPKRGERILDLGCGTGQLTQQIADRGADVVGLDASPEMIGQARQNYPKLRFVLEDAARMPFDREFDAVFSNAALHWIADASAAAERIARSLRRGGRLVAELGGKGNVRSIMDAVESVVVRYCGDAMPARRTYFPSLAEYSSLLELHGLEVHSARLFDRPTDLEGPDGMAHWVRQFESYRFECMPVHQRQAAVAEVVEELRPLLFRNGRWIADYRRLQIVAVKV